MTPTPPPPPPPPRRRRNTMSRALASLVAASSAGARVRAASISRRPPPTGVAGCCFLGGPSSASASASAAIRRSVFSSSFVAASAAGGAPGGGASSSSTSSSDGSAGRRPIQSRTGASTTRLHGVAPRKSYRRRQADKAAARLSDVTSEETGTLDWEKFDYSLSPKLDRRFNEDIRNVYDTVTYEEFVKSESKEDESDRRRMDELNEAYRSLDPDMVRRATAVLLPYVNDDRIQRIDSVLSQRTKHTKFLFENPSNPSNVWACLRTIDSFGVQNVDVVIDSGRYEGKMAVQQKRGMRTAMGSAKWLTLTNHPTTEEAVRRIRDEQGYKIYASDLNPDSIDVREIDWDDAEGDRPVCVVMGNEDRGISDEMRELADVTFTLPMSGFAESFNLSVATSITLAHMSAKSRDGVSGPLRPGDLDPHEVACLRLKGLLGSMPQRRTGPMLLKKAGIELPDTLRAL